MKQLRSPMIMALPDSFYHILWDPLSEYWLNGRLTAQSDLPLAMHESTPTCSRRHFGVDGIFSATFPGTVTLEVAGPAGWYENFWASIMAVGCWETLLITYSKWMGVCMIASWSQVSFDIDNGRARGSRVRGGLTFRRLIGSNQRMAAIFQDGGHKP